MNKTRKTAVLGLLAACAIVLSYVEMLLPPIWAAVPGIKMGLTNIVILFVLYKFSLKYAAAISLTRLLVVLLLFGNFMTFAYSLAGAVLSLVIMAILKKTGWFSMVAVSIAGGISHNLGQVLVAMAVLQTKEIGYYMIALSVSGIVAGMIVGLVSALLIRYIDKFITM
ncbi:MAG: Gx transporter family protein [Ruminococcaceae bacterium]|nr:Gx transporter family protein [Oscillospiraceae bacterium]